MIESPLGAEPADRSSSGPAGMLYKRDFWITENLNYSRPHYRMDKVARLVNKMVAGRECTLLDVGCGPATLASLLQPNIDYYGIDIAIQSRSPNLRETDFLRSPIAFDGRQFDVVVAQGVFEYVGKFQSQKFADVASIIADGGTFVVSYVNFDHRERVIYWPYSNVQAFDDFRRSLAEHFRIRRFFPTSHNWGHWEPSQKLVRTINMHLNVRIPIISRKLAVEYLFICSPRR